MDFSGEDDTGYLLERLENSDGVLSEFFSMLQKRGNHSLEDISIPDTIIYAHGKPISWFCNQHKENRKIHKKSRTKLNSGTIQEAFLQKFRQHAKLMSPAHACRVVAKFIVVNQAPKDPSPMHMTYLDEAGLQNFLLSNNKQNGILQFFVPPKEELPGVLHNATLHITWAPRSHMVEKRVNHSRLPTIAGYGKDAKLKEDEISTMSYANSRLAALNPTLEKTISCISSKIAEHIEAVHQYRVTSLSLTFKLDARERLCLLWCSQIRLVECRKNAHLDSSKLRSLTLGVLPPSLENPKASRSPAARTGGKQQVKGSVQVVNAAKAMLGAVDGEEVLCPLCRRRRPILAMRHMSRRVIIQALRHCRRAVRDVEWHGLVNHSVRLTAARMLQLIARAVRKQLALEEKAAAEEEAASPPPDPSGSEGEGGASPGPGPSASPAASPTPTALGPYAGRPGHPNARRGFGPMPASGGAPPPPPELEPPP